MMAAEKTEARGGGRVARKEASQVKVQQWMTASSVEMKLRGSKR